MRSISGAGNLVAHLVGAKKMFKDIKTAYWGQGYSIMKKVKDGSDTKEDR